MLKQIFWNGLRAFVPVVVIIALIIWVFRNIEAFFGTFLQFFIAPEYYFEGLGIILGVGLIFIVGILVNAWVIKKIYALVESLVKKIPIIKTIYNSIQDFISFFEKSGEPSKKQAVFIKFGNTQLVGFVTKEDLTSLPDEFGAKNNVLVYVPFSYQIGGFMFSLPRKSLTVIDMPANQVMNMVITAGMAGGN